MAWVLVSALVLSLAIAYGAAISPMTGLVVGVVASAIGLALLIITSPGIVIDEESLNVGRASLPRRFIADFRALDEAETNAARDKDARAFLALRPLTSKSAVIIELCDPDDPHPYWLVSTRHPDRFTATLAARPEEDR